MDQLISKDCVGLLDIQQEAKFIRKETGEIVANILEELCREKSISDHRIFYIPVSKNDIHRVMIGNVIINVLSIRNELFIQGYSVPQKIVRSPYSDLGSVAFGNVISIYKIDKHTSYRARDPGWWLCKYSSGEPRLNLTDLNEMQATAVGRELGLDVIDSGYEHLNHSVYGNVNDVQQTSFFNSLRIWARKYPRRAKNGSGQYFAGWGPLALGEAAFNKWKEDFRTRIAVLEDAE